jgi:hypothetical protein
VAGPFLINPLTRGRAITLTFDQFKYGWANALDEKDAKELYDMFHVAGSGIALVQMGNANLNPWTEATVNTKNPDRGPLLIIEGEKDHTVPWAIANAAYKRQRRNPAVTEIVKIPNRGHSPRSTTAGARWPRRRSTLSSVSPKRSLRSDDVLQKPRNASATRGSSTKSAVWRCCLRSKEQEPVSSRWLPCSWPCPAAYRATSRSLNNRTSACAYCHRGAEQDHRTSGTSRYSSC